VKHSAGFDAAARALRSAAAFGLLALMAALPVQGQGQVMLHDDRGAAHRFDTPPARIVSLVPSLTESLCALGACARLVGTDRFSNWPDSVRGLPKLGGLSDARIEAIAQLAPDVVLATPSARVVERLEALGIRVLVLQHRTHADVQRSLSTLSQMLGEPALGALQWQQIQQQLERAVARVPAALRGRSVYFEVDPAPYAAGTASFIGETLQRLGLINIVPASFGPFPKLSPEFVVRAHPALQMSEARYIDDMAQRPGWSALHALRVGRVCAFETAEYEMLVRPGPRLGEAAMRVADCLVRLARADR
jgi:iron complex transport system substrate-binding protein